MAGYCNQYPELLNLVVSTLQHSGNELSGPELFESLAGRFACTIRVMEPGLADKIYGGESRFKVVLLLYRESYGLLYPCSKENLLIADTLCRLPLATLDTPEERLIPKLLSGTLGAQESAGNTISREEGSVVISKFSRPDDARSKDSKK
jgi:hypothetical protein